MSNSKYTNMQHTCIKCKEELRLYPPDVVARQISCGHRLCPGCFEKVLKISESKKPCPGSDSDEEDSGDDCRNSNMKDAHPDYAFKRDLAKIIVYCENKTHGCKMEMEWSILDDHMKTCSFNKVQCENQGCQVVVSLCEMNNHMSGCEYGNHSENCRKKELMSKVQGIFPSVDGTSALPINYAGGDEQDSN